MMAIYECIGKDGRYRILAKTIGAGKSRGEYLIVYQCIEDGECYHRTVEDFKDRMRAIDGDPDED